MNILVDAMGGDNAPDEIVRGCIEAVKESEGFDVEIIGDVSRVQKILERLQYNQKRIKLTNATEVISNSDKPTRAIKKKKDSSMVIGFEKLKKKCGEVFISAGSTGALLAGSLLIAGRMKGVLRPALAPVVPSMSGGTMIIDAGMNTVCKPVNYLQFAIIGSIYMNCVYGLKNPRIGLINVGSEPEKGSKTIKEAYFMLKDSGLNFVGNVEGRDINEGVVDVAVCDGFTGNVMLKMMEGTGKFFMSHLKRIYKRNIFTKLSAFLVKRELLRFRRSVDPDIAGGTPVLGIDGVVYKCHGNANAKTVKNTIIKAVKYVKSAVGDKIAEKFSDMEVDEIG